MTVNENAADRSSVNLPVAEGYTTMAQQLDSQSTNEGLGAWLQALGAFLVYTATWGLLSAYGSYQSYYESNLLASTPPNDIAWVGTVEGVLLIMGGVVTGPLYDRGHIRELLVIGTLLTVFGVMMLSLASEYYQVMLAQGICVGIGSGILYTPSIALVASCFAKRRALAICLATSGTAVGGILYPIVFVRLLPQVGFAWATRTLGFITLFELAVALVIILPHAKGRRDTFEARSLFEVDALKEPAFVVLCLALFFMWVAYWVPFFFIPTYGQFKLGASRTFSFYLLVITNAATLPGRLLAVLISSRIGVSETLLGFSIASGVLLFAWLGIPSLASFEAWIVLLGVFMAPLAVLVPAIIPQLCPNKHVVGTRMGMAWAAAALGILVGAPVSSKLNDLDTCTFWKSQILIATCMMVGAALMVYVQRQIARQKQNQI
ncbi:MAG: hypothetical protein M1830_005963 [Pleopsidium flavum]|nr:MAG: hypothetical protein M1830_005963 [Pleopsidium flavum]